VKRELLDEEIESRLRERAGRLVYPSTPDIAGAVWQRTVRGGARIPARGRRMGARRLVVAFGVALVMVVGVTLAVPGARAFVGSFVARIGTISIFVATPTPTVAPGTTVVDWAGPTTLEDAKTRAGFPLRVPSYPPSLGSPDRVFVQDAGGLAVVMVWLEPGYPDKMRLVLYEARSGTTSGQGVADGRVLSETRVLGEKAQWVEGPHIMEYKDREAVKGESAPGTRRLVDGKVLVWEKAGISYRLYAAVPMRDAVVIGQSFQIYLPSPTDVVTPVPTYTPIAEDVLASLVGATTLEDAQKKVSFKIKLPVYPPGIGPPDKVFLQYFGDPVLILVWLEPGTENRAKMVLYEIPPTVHGEKTLEDVNTLTTTQVNGHHAEWATGTHLLELRSGMGQSYQAKRRLVSGNLLLWSEDEKVTYRLESAFTLLEALRVAESLR
jgi:hypothetical protein